MSSVPGKLLNQENIIKKVFDETTDSLRTTAVLTVPPGGINVNLSAASGDNVAVSDGVDTLLVNPDGSINVNAGSLVISHLDDSIKLGDGTNLITSTTLGLKQGLDVNIINNGVVSGTLVNTFNAISSVASATLTTIVTRTITQNSVLKKCSVSGENIAKYEVVLNGSVISSKRTYFGNSLNADFDFEDGIPLVNTDIVLVRVIHNRPNVGNFNGNIITKEGI